MNWLAIDIGNTTIAVTEYDGDLAVEQFRVDTRTVATTDIVRDVELVLLCSVVPAVGEVVEQAFTAKGVPVTLVERDVVVPVEVTSLNRKEIGADRLVCAYAAWQQVGGGAIVLDFGTATTFDVIDASGNYQGGVIAPGVNLSLKALEQAAAKLPDIKIEAPESVTGKSTTHAMQSGIYYGYLSMVEGVISRLKAEHTDVKQVIATGGLASFFAKDCASIDTVHDNLMMQGLVLLKASL